MQLTRTIKVRNFAEIQRTAQPRNLDFIQDHILLQARPMPSLKKLSGGCQRTHSGAHHVDIERLFQHRFHIQALVELTHVR